MKHECSLCIVGLVLTVLILFLVIKIVIEQVPLTYGEFGENKSQRAGFKDSGELS